MLRKTLYNFASQLLSLGVAFGDRFVLAAILLRVWSTDLYADWATISACAGLMGLVDLGFVVFLGNQLQKTFNHGDELEFQRFVGFGVFVYSAMALVLLVALAGLVKLEANAPFLSTRSLTPSESAVVLLLLGLAQIVHSLKSALSQVYRGRGSFARGILIDSLSSGCIVMCAIAAALGGANVAVLAMTYIGAHLVFGWGILLADIRRRYPAIRLTPSWPHATQLRDAAHAMRWYAVSCTVPLIWLQAPVLGLSVLGLSGAAVVSFVVHRTLVNFCRTFAVMLSTAAGVELTPHVHAGNTAEVERGLVMIGRLAGLIGGVMVGALMQFGGPLIQFWTGKSDLLDMPTLLWLAVPAITVAPAMPLLYLAHLADLPKPMAHSQIAQLIIAFVFALLLARPFGAAGVAFALAVGETLAIGLLLPYLVGRQLHIRFVRHSIVCWSLAVGAVLWSAGVASAIASCIEVVDVFSLILAGLSWTCVALPPVAYLALPAPQQIRLTRAARETMTAQRQRFRSKAMKRS